MPLYESLFFIRGKCQPTEIVSSLTKAAKCVTSNGGVIRQLDNLGKRPLAYPMKKQKQKSRFGFLYRFRSECAPANIISLDRLLRLDENVIRHMTTKLNPTKVLNDIIPQENPVLWNADRTTINSVQPKGEENRMAWLFRHDKTTTASTTESKTSPADAFGDRISSILSKLKKPGDEK